MAAHLRLTAVLWITYWTATSLAGQRWTYEGTSGPEYWSELGYKDCDHHRQSPIAINTGSVILRHLDPLELCFFDQVPLKMNLTNTNRGAEATMVAGRVPLVRGGALTAEYQVVRLHFHWGQNNTVGSEHILDGTSFPLEMHIVCRNTRYSDMAQAMQRPDGLAVLAVWFQVDPTPSSGLVLLAPALAQISAGGSSVVVDSPPSLLELLPSNTGDFFRYEGSLTTPGCYEVVTWTVFKETVKVTKDQLQLFRSLKGDQKPIGPNYRVVQLPYGRRVYERKPLDEEDSGLGLVSNIAPTGSGDTAKGVQAGLLCLVLVPAFGVI